MRQEEPRAKRAKQQADWEQSRLEVIQKAERVLLEKKAWHTPMAHTPGRLTIDVDTQSRIPACTETDWPVNRSWFNDTLIDAYANLVMIKQSTTPIVAVWEDRVTKYT